MNVFPKKVIFFVFLLFVADSLQALTILAKNGGHPAVTQSLLAGLRKLKIPFTYCVNLRSYNNVVDEDTVVVLAGIDYLIKSIRLKKRGRFKKLLVGPNLVIRADEYGGICGRPEVDVCIVASEWVRVAFEEEVPSLKGRIEKWAAGVDERFWSPSTKKRSKILLYWKTESEDFISQIEGVVRKFPFELIRVRYGTYRKEQYRDLLDQDVLAVFVSASETQGLALTEAWAMDVPTFVWNPEKLVDHGRVYSQVSSAPYLISLTGCFWKNTDELAGLLHKFMNNSFEFKPREYVLEHFTDQCAAQNMLNIISSIQ